LKIFAKRDLFFNLKRNGNRLVSAHENLMVMHLGTTACPTCELWAGALLCKDNCVNYCLHVELEKVLRTDNEIVVLFCVLSNSALWAANMSQWSWVEFNMWRHHDARNEINENFF